MVKIETLMAEYTDRRQIFGARVGQVAVDAESILIFCGLETAAGAGVLVAVEYLLTRLRSQLGGPCAA